MTKTKTIDKREDTFPTFGQLCEGDAFTYDDGSTVFVKTAVMYDKDKNPHNTISLDGGFYWFDVDDEVEPIYELEIIIKK